MNGRIEKKVCLIDTCTVGHSFSFNAVSYFIAMFSLHVHFEFVSYMQTDVNGSQGWCEYIFVGCMCVYLNLGWFVTV
ncbi:hypothetical protein EDC04DRAFT_1458660 [Pisolithus marmoratus]|nr:hypothetical protein EDC04DRAFT_1458660 [Pisolithus marmoratus]